ncbi:Acetyltransferase (GNAT) family protein [Tenacibaculum sp. MAR_2009_124]|uniref:GNAT family N-acetyltransferase n=1 Tax=Tenacibaculum sp. MAR_2009_124 TaxID=1250059 RepID=UPI00089D1BB1|nr:GNAT family N-acetyltransferase [Tenacibaculum sp. MAR_2009_124]SEC43163.1 Acetyltransferase (GNAT) family protein [Tenacibaculum sp. MAR_2009_124]
MIQISDTIQLEEISNDNFNALYSLMKEVYPAAYSHFWKDGGNWYVNSQYSKENILKELSEKNADYYYVLFNGEKVGNFRILWNKELEGFSEKRIVKLHRIYLHKNVQGKGVGKLVLNWLEEQAMKKQYEYIWLDAMDEQSQAFNFYKRMGYQYHSHCFLDFELLYDEVRKMSQVYKKL